MCALVAYEKALSLGDIMKSDRRYHERSLAACDFSW